MKLKWKYFYIVHVQDNTDTFNKERLPTILMIAPDTYWELFEDVRRLEVPFVVLRFVCVRV